MPSKGPKQISDYFSDGRTPSDGREHSLAPLSLPSLDERVSFYLTALHGRREFTTRERSKARAALLREMVANLSNDKRGVVRPEPILDRERIGLGPIETHLYDAMREEASCINRFALRRDEEFALHCAEEEVVSVAASIPAYDSRGGAVATPYSAPTSAARAARSDIRQVETRPRPRNRRVFALVATTAVFALAIILVLPFGWFNSHPDVSRRSVVALWPSPEKTVESLKFDLPTAAVLPTAAAQIESTRIAELLKRGNDLIAAGDVAAARPLLKQAADAGSADAALALGATFDPVEIEKLRKRNVSPDIAIASTWYAKAYDLGSIHAPERLKRLGRWPLPNN
jgi:hypothetical protein